MVFCTMSFIFWRSFLRSRRRAKTSRFCITLDARRASSFILCKSRLLSSSVAFRIKRSENPNMPVRGLFISWANPSGQLANGSQPTGKRKFSLQPSFLLLSPLALSDINEIAQDGTPSPILNGGNCLQSPPYVSPLGINSILIGSSTISLQHINGTFSDGIPVFWNNKLYTFHIQ